MDGWMAGCFNQVFDGRLGGLGLGMPRFKVCPACPMPCHIHSPERADRNSGYGYEMANPQIRNNNLKRSPQISNLNGNF